MKRIEPIGSSNVGKATLYNKINEIPFDERPYLTLKGAYKIGVISQDISIKNLRLWLFIKKVEEYLILKNALSTTSRHYRIRS